MSVLIPAATAAATTAGLWFIPILAAAVSYYQYDKTDPEGRPKDTKVLYSNAQFKTLLQTTEIITSTAPCHTSCVYVSKN